MRPTRGQYGRGIGAGLSALMTLAVVPAVLAAQSLDSRWLPWLGCWQPSGAAAASDMIVCVAPQDGGTGIEVRSVTGGQTVGTRTLVADGQRHNFTENECTGWQTAQFSNDGRRAYLRSQMTCDGQVRAASAIMAMATPNEWLDAQGIGSGDERAARVLRYTPASDERVRSAGLLPPSPERVMATADARLLAAVDLTLDDIKEAAPLVDAEALEAFIVELGQPFQVDADALMGLADAGVPDRVIDLVVAVSFPDRFALDREDADAALRPEERRPRADRDRYDPFGWGGYGRYGYGGYGYGLCYGYGYDRWDYDPFFYSPLGYGRGGCYDSMIPGRYGFMYGRPIIIVRGPDDDGGTGVEPRSRVVNGRGYTRGGSGSSGSSRGSSSGGSTVSGSSTGRTAVPRATSGGYTTGSGSSGASSSGGSSGGSSSGRTAKTRGGGGN